VVVEDITEGVAAAFSAAGLTHQVTFTAVTFGGLSISRLTLLPSADDTGLHTVDLVRLLSDRYATAVMRRTLAGPLRGRPPDPMHGPARSEGSSSPGRPSEIRPPCAPSARVVDLSGSADKRGAKPEHFFLATPYLV
jgi:hypothetical protein